MRYFHKTMGPEDVKKYQGGGPKVWKRVAGFEGGSKSRRGVQKTLKQRSLPDKEFLFLMEKKGGKVSLLDFPVYKVFDDLYYVGDSSVHEKIVLGTKEKKIMEEGEEVFYSLSGIWRSCYTTLRVSIIGS